MSCTYCGNDNEGSGANCLCDVFIHPLPLRIDAGLSNLPRQIATFPEFRRAMLHAVRNESVTVNDVNNLWVTIKPLSDWRARDKDDLGIMLLEMWAYVCDCLSFYDQVIANETYLRTSTLRPNLRKLVALLGYQPRPAIASTVELSAIAEGRLLVTLPSGTGFRSTAFNGNPPQVFELDSPQLIHPATNKYDLLPPRETTVASDYPDALLIEPVAEIKPDDLVVVAHMTDNMQTRALKIKSLAPRDLDDNQTYTFATFQSATALRLGSLLGDLRILSPTRQCGLWTSSQPELSIVGNRIALASQLQEISAGDIIIMNHQLDIRWFRVTNVASENRQAIPNTTVTINGNTYTMPGVAVPVTVLTLDEDVNASARKFPFNMSWTQTEVGVIKVGYGMIVCGLAAQAPRANLLPTDRLQVGSAIELPVEDYRPSRFLLQDKNTRGAFINANLDVDAKELDLIAVNEWAYPLAVPVRAFGNVITASRGEKVLNEKMGSGDASVPSQTFKLKKKPLTYFSAPSAANDAGVKSSLSVFVNGVRWKEVPSFFNTTENDQVYIVRQNDDGDSLVTFGDGIRGQRLPPGVDNVVGNYRFGAEGDSPPALSVSQIATPVKGLQSVKNMLPAYGGEDAEKSESLRGNAPRSALILGRVVSLKDMEALVAAFRGVRSVQTEWRWDLHKQRASAHIFYIGDPGLTAEISKRVRSFADPSTPISVEPALPVLLYLSLDVTIDPRYVVKEVISNLRALLTAPKTGFLLPESLGIGSAIFRSRIFEQVLSVEGILSVTGIWINDISFEEYAATPETGNYYDIEHGKLIINGFEN